MVESCKRQHWRLLEQEKRIYWPLHHINSCKTSKKSAQGSKHCVWTAVYVYPHLLYANTIEGSPPAESRGGARPPQMAARPKLTSNIIVYTKIIFSSNLGHIFSPNVLPCLWFSRPWLFWVGDAVAYLSYLLFLVSRLLCTVKGCDVYIYHLVILCHAIWCANIGCVGASVRMS